LRCFLCLGDLVAIAPIPLLAPTRVIVTFFCGRSTGKCRRETRKGLVGKEWKGENFKKTDILLTDRRKTSYPSSSPVFHVEW
jgi:hypothetical protein